MVSESLILTGRTTVGYTSLLERNSSKIKKSKQKKIKIISHYKTKKYKISIKIQAQQSNTVEFAE